MLYFDVSSVTITNKHYTKCIGKCIVYTSDDSGKRVVDYYETEQELSFLDAFRSCVNWVQKQGYKGEFRVNADEFTDRRYRWK